MKKASMLLIALMVVSVGLLSGCTQNGDVSGDTSKVELVSYDVKTTWRTGTYSSDIQNHEQDGFYHDIPSDAYSMKYIITGTVKNIAGKMLNSVKITAKFYDSNDNYLDSESTTKSNLANSYTWDFTITYYSSSGSYFENIDKVKFEFEAS